MNYEPFTSIENPTLAHFRHFSSLFTLSPLYICRERSTNQPFYAKQTQFPKGQMNVSIYLQTAYENKRNWTIGQSKPNSKPIKPNLQDTQMSVNSILTKVYERNDIFAVPENKPNSNPIQTQTKPISMPIKPNQTQSQNPTPTLREAFFLIKVQGLICL
jgi:hypothetical protein